MLRSPWTLMMTSTHGNNSSYTSVTHEFNMPAGHGKTWWHHNYSNQWECLIQLCFRYGVVAHVTEVLAGESWEALMTSRLFQPIGMLNTTISYVTDYSEADIAKCYLQDNKGNFRLVKNPIIWFFPQPKLSFQIINEKVSETLTMGRLSGIMVKILIVFNKQYCKYIRQWHHTQFTVTSSKKQTTHRLQ